MAIETHSPALAMQPVPGTLAHLPRQCRATVTAVRMRGAEVTWLRAIGIFEGQGVTVLRRALLGGPLHVRTASGGEFAIDRSLALAIDVSIDAARVES